MTTNIFYKIQIQEQSSQQENIHKEPSPRAPSSPFKEHPDNSHSPRTPASQPGVHAHRPPRNAHPSGDPATWRTFHHLCNISPRPMTMDQAQGSSRSSMNLVIHHTTELG